MSARLTVLEAYGFESGYALVDPVDFERFSRYTWRFDRKGYVVRSAGGVRPRLHREVLGLEPNDGLIADHINGDRRDNRRSNLRVVTSAQNAQNVVSAGGRSRFRGVCFHAARGKWQASVKVNGVSHYLGLFEDEETAAAVASAARMRLMTHSNESRHLLSSTSRGARVATAGAP